MSCITFRGADVKQSGPKLWRAWGANLRSASCFTIAALALLLSTINLQPLTIFAQGSLTPTGAPAPMFKTLDQIEPRVPISTLPFTITNSGSYYLRSNLTLVSASSENGVTILTNNVT